MVDALKRASAKRITVILPFYGYARQDKKHRGREPISARLMADLFKTAGADRLMCVDLHTSQIQGFFDGPVDHLFALPLLTNYVGSKVDRKNLVIVSPDSGRVRVAERWSELLGGCSIAFIHKTRDPKVPNEATVGKVVGDVKGMTCVVIDDMIDTAGTLVKAAEVLKATGAQGLMIGRAAQGNPWIFREISSYLATGQAVPPPALSEISTVMLGHLRALHAFYGPVQGVRIARKHIAWYVKSRMTTTQFLPEFFAIDDPDGQISHLSRYLQSMEYVQEANA